MTWLESTIKRVRAYEESVPRSLQSEPGWSEVGGCRSYLGFRLEGAWHSDDPDGWGAARGHAIHKYLEGIMGDEGEWVEVVTTYRGIPGHADLVVDPGSVTDWKSTKLSNSRLWASSPEVLWEKRVQVHGYGAGLIDARRLPEDATVRLCVIPVDGTYADWWAWEEPFNRSIADWGADRLDEVRDRMAAGERLPQDKPWKWCIDWCPFFSLCREPFAPDAEAITDPELVAAIARYGDITQRITKLYKEKDGLAELIRGLRGTAGDWRISLGKGGDDQLVPDEAAIRADYAARDEEMPVTMKAGTRPRLTVTRIKKAAGR